MKKFIIALVAMFMLTFTSASAMSYEQARQQALFLTDKMAWLLPLRHLCTLPTQRLLLLRKTSFLYCISWWTQLENEWWQKLVSRT